MLSRKFAQGVFRQRSWSHALRSGYDTVTDYCRRRGSYHSFSESTSPTPPRRRGNVFIGVGWALLGLVAVDQILQYKQEYEAREHRQILYQMQAEANDENEVQWDVTLPTLYTCKVSRTEISLDGTKMLRNVRLGDVVEILETKIGPNQAYHLCRNPAATSKNRPGSIGWYPLKYLERID